MSDSGTPKNTPDDDATPAPSTAGAAAQPGNAASQPANPASQPSDPTAMPTHDLPSTGVALEDVPDAPSGRLAALVHSRKVVWGAVAVLCFIAGTIGSVIAARSVARNDSKTTQQSFQQSSAGISSAVKLALQREEELGVSASTFFAANSKASPAEFARWVRWARTLHRFPELENLGLVTLVRSPELPAFEAQISGRPLKAPAATTSVPAGSSSRTSGSNASTVAPAAGATATAAAAAGATATAAAAAAAAATLPPGLRIVPASDHHYYCLTSAELVRSHAGATPSGLDSCAQSPVLLLARDAGESTYTATSLGHSQALAIEMPVYRGNVTPRSVFGRGAASVGWLREVLLPQTMLAQALHGHPGNAVTLRYRNSNVLFSSGAPQAGAQSATVNLHNGWSVTSFAAPASADVFSDGTALAVLIGGILLSALLGLIVFLLGSPRSSSTPAPKTRTVPNVDLYDTLTGLPNRALTLDRAERMVARAGRQSGMLAGALFIDIDWFKDVNLKLGEAAGDQLLSIVAERLEGVVRAGDTVGRLGGDEFVVLVESAARGVRLDSLARRVIESLHKPVELDGFGPSFFATASIGVAFGRYETPTDLLRDAQLALFAAKAAGKDRYTLFNANMRSVIESRAVLEAELNTALNEKQFFLLYQPVCDLDSHKVVGLEAQIRWSHPKQGVLDPDAFIPLAEDTGLIVPIGRWALEEACNRGAAWNVGGPRVGVSVKISEFQLIRDGFATDVRRALQQSGIEPSLLTLEIDETTVMRDLSATAERLEEIKRLGVRIAIDDFGGSGYARHSDLQRLPLDALKVDRNSLAVSEDENYRSWLLEAILVVGHDMSLSVVATGVETPEQMADLQAVGCTIAQGPFIGKPIPVDAVESLLGGGFPVARPAPQAMPSPALVTSAVAAPAPAPTASPTTPASPAAPASQTAPAGPAAAKPPVRPSSPKPTGTAAPTAPQGAKASAGPARAAAPAKEAAPAPAAKPAPARRPSGPAGPADPTSPSQ
jgi:diguanylate cyclase (GGDEF)-like protein